MATTNEERERQPQLGTCDGIDPYYDGLRKIATAACDLTGLFRPPNGERAPYNAAPDAIHEYGCPATRYGKKSGPCNCGADELGEKIDAAWEKLLKLTEQSESPAPAPEGGDGCGWIVLRLKDGEFPEVAPMFGETGEADARHLYADWSANWSDVYLCKVVGQVGQPSASAAPDRDAGSDVRCAIDFIRNSHQAKIPMVSAWADAVEAQARRLEAAMGIVQRLAVLHEANLPQGQDALLDGYIAIAAAAAAFLAGDAAARRRE